MQRLGGQDSKRSSVQRNSGLGSLPGRCFTFSWSPAKGALRESCGEASAHRVSRRHGVVSPRIDFNTCITCGSAPNDSSGRAERRRARNSFRRLWISRTSRRPLDVSSICQTRRSFGSGTRFAKPRFSSRSTSLVIVDGLTLSISANWPSVKGPLLPSVARAACTVAVNSLLDSCRSRRARRIVTSRNWSKVSRSISGRVLALTDRGYQARF